MKANLDNLGRIAQQRQNQIRTTPLVDEEGLVMKDGVLVFTGELEEDPDRALQRDREERLRKVAGLD